MHEVEELIDEPSREELTNHVAQPRAHRGRRRPSAGRYGVPDITGREDVFGKGAATFCRSYARRMTESHLPVVGIAELALKWASGPYSSPTGVAKISERRPVDRTAPPQLSTTRSGDSVEIPKVSPGQTPGLPN